MPRLGAAGGRATVPPTVTWVEHLPVRSWWQRAPEKIYPIISSVKSSQLYQRG
jgi:hypothetical protein